MFSITHHDELKQMIDDNAPIVILDVLPEESFLKHHLPGAINIPLHSEHFEEMAERLISDKSATVIVYCKDHECQASPKACSRLAQMGYKNVSDYENGLAEWMAMGYPLGD